MRNVSIVASSMLNSEPLSVALPPGQLDVPGWCIRFGQTRSVAVEGITAIAWGWCSRIVWDPAANPTPVSAPCRRMGRFLLSCCHDQPVYCLWVFPSPHVSDVQYLLHGSEPYEDLGSLFSLRVLSCAWFCHARDIVLLKNATEKNGASQCSGV